MIHSANQSDSSVAGGVEWVDASLRYTKVCDGHGDSGSSWRLGQVVDVLRSPDRTREREELLKVVICRLGGGRREAEEVLGSLERAFRPVSMVKSCELGADEASRVDREYEAFLEARKGASGHGNDHCQGRAMAPLVYDLALRKLTDLPPHGRNLSSTEAKREMVADTVKARRALRAARSQVRGLLKRCDGDLSAVLDITEQRYEKRELVSSVHLFTSSLNALFRRAANRGVGDALRAKALSMQQDAATATALMKARSLERRRTYRAGAEAAKCLMVREMHKKRPERPPNGLNLAVQPFLKGERPIGTLKAEDLRGFYRLSAERNHEGQLHALNSVLRFRSAASRLFLLQGGPEAEVEEHVRQLLAERTPFLRREKFRELTGLDNIVRYKPASFGKGTELERVLHQLAWAQMGFFLGRDVSRVLSQAEINRVRDEVARHPGEEPDRGRNSAECRAILRPFILEAVSRLGRAGPNWLRKRCREDLGLTVAHETVRRQCEALVREGLLRRRTEFDNRSQVQAGRCRLRMKRVVYRLAGRSAAG